MVVNARHMKAVPGRKTDTRDSEWIADLLQHGLLQAGYIPDKDQRELREPAGYRKSLVGERNRELNCLQEMLEGANIKLSGTITDINGKSARSLLEAIPGGISAGKARLDEMKELLAHLDELNVHIKHLDDEIDHHMKSGEKQAVAAIKSITGIADTSARAVIVVIGTGMGRFPSDAHMSFRAGLCPGDNESAGKHRSGKTRKGNALLRSTLVVCAHSAVKCKNSYFYAQYKRISTRRGSKCAYVAVAHSMLIAIYHILKNSKH